MVEFSTVDLGRQYPGKIDDFARARNSFLENLPDNHYVLFVDSDEEAPLMLLDHIKRLEPEHPYYWVRRIELSNDNYFAGCNPNFKPALVSSRVRFTNRIHEKIVPKNPHGIIQIPIIHNHRGTRQYDGISRLRAGRLGHYWQGAKKMVEVARGR
jgi:hypothetical protein